MPIPLSFYSMTLLEWPLSRLVTRPCECVRGECTVYTSHQKHNEQNASGFTIRSLLMALPVGRTLLGILFESSAHCPDRGHFFPSFFVSFKDQSALAFLSSQDVSHLAATCGDSHPLSPTFEVAMKVRSTPSDVRIAQRSASHAHTLRRKGCPYPQPCCETRARIRRMHGPCWNATQKLGFEFRHLLCGAVH